VSVPPERGRRRYTEREGRSSLQYSGAVGAWERSVFPSRQDGARARVQPYSGWLCMGLSLDLRTST